MTTFIVGTGNAAQAAGFSSPDCSGFTNCLSKGYDSFGYAAVFNNRDSHGLGFWTMEAGHNCTNYVAFRLIQNGYKTSFLESGQGNAYQWGPRIDVKRAAGDNSITKDTNPTVGSIAWWDENSKMGIWGHVAYVESVSGSTIVVSEDISGGDFHWRTINTTNSNYPTAFLHIKDVAPSVQVVTPPSSSFDSGAKNVAKLKQDAMNKVVKLAGSSVSYFYDGTLYQIPDADTYSCLVDKQKRAIYPGASVAEAKALGDGNQWAICVDKDKAKNKVITVAGSSASYYYDGISLRSIPDGDTYYCLTGKEKRPIFQVISQLAALTLGSGQTSMPVCVDPARVMNKVVTVVGSVVSYFYDGTLHWIPDGETYFCLTGRDKRQKYQVGSQAAVNSLGYGQPAVSQCVDPARALGRILHVKSTGNQYTYDSKGLHYISSAAIAACLKSKGWSVLEVDNQDHAKSLGNGKPWAKCATPTIAAKTLATKPPATSTATSQLTVVAPPSMTVLTVDPPNNPVLNSPTPVTSVPATPAVPGVSRQGPTTSETTGSSGSDTFANFSNESGVGTRIGGLATILVSCKTTGFALPNGNNWWYRIAQSPWSDQYYAPADNFYNNGHTSGSLAGTPYMDANVPNCGSTPTTPAPTPTAPASTPVISVSGLWGETTGSVAHTWSNYSSAGGLSGQPIESNSTVQISCRISGFRVADGNTWWYRIAQSPWSNQFYVSADAFYNNGATSGSLIGTPQVDANISECSASPSAAVVTPVSPPPPVAQVIPPSVSLSQGPVAPHGYRYAITLSHFAPNAAISVNCYDSVSPGGFFPFTMTTDGAGNASTASECYSGDGPDHWTIAGGVASNHIQWNAAAVAPVVAPVPAAPVIPPSVALSQGPTAPYGYRYAISLSHFAPNSSISVNCYDSISSGGFFSFTMATDASGNSSTASQCYSADGPDHWVIAGGVASNHVQWTVAAPAPVVVAPPPAPAPTWGETTGSVANTWTNYSNAGGSQGPGIGSNQTVAISCKVGGFRVADGNTWWYRIAQAPWSNQYFVSADAFYNNGATSGSLHGTPYYDPAVPNC